MSEPPKKKKQRISLALIKVEPPDVTAETSTTDSSSQRLNEESGLDRCSICWNEPPVNAIRLDCNHLFCFLCIKSVAAATGRCALCRAEIDKDFDFGEFELVGEPKLPTGGPNGMYWFYEGKTGWWLYDADTNKELEEAHQNGMKQIERLISGQIYVINLVMSKQYQKSEPSRSRKICRRKLDLDNILGMAGIRDKNLVKSMRRRQQTEASSTPHRQSGASNDANNNSISDEDSEDHRF